jgi:hypothetical protein
MTDRLGVVCRHLALVAIDGATDEVASTMTADFRLHVEGTTTDRWGYLALIDARWAAEGPRPPLDVLGDHVSGDQVAIGVAPHCLAHFGVRDELISEVWMTPDWRPWTVPLAIDRTV